MKFLKILGILFIFLLAVGVFYWYEIRPKAIKKECNSQALEKKGSKEMYEVRYLICTREKEL